MFYDYSSMTLDIECQTAFQSGGSLGNDVVVTMNEGALFELSGGQLDMALQSKVQGEGFFNITQGYHNMAGIIDALITISGGTLVWPRSRGDGQKATFAGGLIIDNIGRLEVVPWSTTIDVKNLVRFQDECLVQFPMIGIASQPGLSDRQVAREDRLDAPDNSPSGVLTAVDKMEFLGGTLRGKAKFIVTGSLLLDGDEKRIRSLAKLINRGNATWGTGNIITADQGDFLNLGTLEMKNYESFNGESLFEGTIIPTENGGDRYALNFHSWDMDEGQLDFTEYIDTRKRLVSKAPPGWETSWQNGKDDQTLLKRLDGSTAAELVGGVYYGTGNEVTGTFEEEIPTESMSPYLDR
jgi:hypothetical protein